MKGIALETIAYVAIALVGVFLLIIFVSGPLNDFLRNSFCYFYQKVFSKNTEMCKPIETIPEQVVIKTRDSKELAREIAAYSILCWEKATKSLKTKDTNCYNLILDGGPFNPSITEAYLTDEILIGESGCNRLENSIAKDVNGNPVDYSSKCGKDDQLGWEVGGDTIGIGCINPNDYQDASAQISELQIYHPGCDDLSKSQSSDCYAAYHRYCIDKGYDGGVPQEVNSIDGILVYCFNSMDYGDADISDLKSHNFWCDDLGKTQAAECYSAYHRYCIGKGYDGGFPQEVQLKVGVFCFNDGNYRDVQISELKGYHPGCDGLEKSQSPDCYAAYHRYCIDKGYKLGVPQEKGRDIYDQKLILIKYVDADNQVVVKG